VLGEDFRVLEVRGKALVKQAPAPEIIAAYLAQAKERGWTHEFALDRARIDHGSGIDLSMRNLRGAKLNNSRLDKADLRGADLGESSLEFASLRYTKMFEANLRRADLSNADLTGADLIYAELPGALLSRP